MIFDKQAFIRNADIHIKKLIPAAHIEVLDGVKVEFDDDRFGMIPHYEVNGEEFYLYPVDRDWCSECIQLSLFDVKGGNL